MSAQATWEAPIARLTYVVFGISYNKNWSSYSEMKTAHAMDLLEPHSDEIQRPENDGLQGVRTKALQLLSKYSGYGIGAADLVQFMHNVATVTCPLGPKLLTLIGRHDRDEANLPGLIPSNNASDPAFLIELFQNKTITPQGLAALLGAHTVAQQFYIDPSRAGQPLDSTPGVWDTNFYREMALTDPPRGVFRLQSDAAISQANGISSRFQAFTDETFGQTVWNAQYSAAYVRLSLLGVNNINQLTDCTKVLPDAITSFSA
ncbi:heme peroxidase [Penicillium argentinense]|uniref:Peroxidase n=1 Tax=Penicillium argentinense TaxID=1131581 RepID=A0A9W9G558_9EURO|nr:heme peroxidase [Penicillium argentinense]KAJ5112143.1 heme peroxidase [Penicillium argentinense]